MRQITLAWQDSFERYAKKTRREKFLEEMDGVMPWSELEALIEPHYPKEGNGRPPMGLRMMLRIYFLQHWFNLSDPAAEEALYDSPALRRFAGVDLGRAPAPDETTILNFRHLLEAHDLCGSMLDAVTIICRAAASASAPARSSMPALSMRPRRPRTRRERATSRCTDAPDQEGQPVVLRHEGAHRRGRQRRAGSFALFDGGLSSRQAYVADLLHGEERKVWGDGAYQGQGEAIRQAAPKAQDMTSRRTRSKDGIDEV
jgi:transposase, IS5 family